MPSRNRTIDDDRRIRCRYLNLARRREVDGHGLARAVGQRERCVRRLIDEQLTVQRFESQRACGIPRAVENRAVAAGRENDRPNGRNQPSSVIEVDPDGRAAFGAEDSDVPGAGTSVSRRWTPIVCIPPCVPSSAGSAGPSVSRRPKMGGRAERKHHHQSRKGSPDFHRATVRVARSFMYGEICREASTPRVMRRDVGTLPHSLGLPERTQWCSAYGAHDSNQ